MSTNPTFNTTIPLPSPPSSCSSQSYFRMLNSAESTESNLPIPSSYYCHDTQIEQLPSPPMDYSTISQESYFNLDQAVQEEERISATNPWALQLSFGEENFFPPLSAPANLSSFESVSSPDATSPLSAGESSFSNATYSTSASSVSHLDPSPRAPYVQTFRIPAPATPPSSTYLTPSASSPSSMRPLHSSPSLSAALSVLEQTSPWTPRDSVSTLKSNSDLPSTSLFTTLESAAEHLRLPVASPYEQTRKSISPRPAPLQMQPSPKRPKPYRSTTEPYSPATSISSTTSSLPPKSPSKSKGKKRPEGHIPRAPNAWILYRSARVKQLTETGEAPKLQSDISKLVASLWREESAEVKEVYARRASIEAKLHAERYPGYSYKPAQSGLPRRKPSSKKLSDTGRSRAKTTSALEAHLSGFSIAASSAPQTPSVLLPSPFESQSPTNSSYSIGGSYSTMDDYPFTSSTNSTFDSTLPSTPNSSASEAWTVFQASGLPTFEYALPDPSPMSNYSTSNEPFSAPANLSTFPFSFSQPPPVFEPFHESPISSSFDMNCSPSSIQPYPSVLAPALPLTPPAQEATYEEFLATLPVDQSGQISVPVSSTYSNGMTEPSNDETHSTSFDEYEYPQQQQSEISQDYPNPYLYL